MGNIPIEGKKNIQADLLSRLPHDVNALTRVKRIKRVGEEEAIEEEIDNTNRVRKLPLYDDVSEYEGSDVIACICNQNKEVGIMIQCDLCDRWSHAECYSFDEGDIQYDFTCQYCQGKEMPTIDDFEQVEAGNNTTSFDIDSHNESDISKRRKDDDSADSDDEVGCLLLLQAAHKYHAAIGSMRILLRSYRWEGKDKDIIDFVNSCSYCVEKNSPRRSKMNLRVPRKLNEYVGLDLMEVDECEYKYIVVIKEMFSGAVYLRPTFTKEAVETFKSLVGYISCFGYPQTLVYDAGTEFLGMFRKFVEKEDLFTENSTPYIKHENGLSERAINQVQGVLRVIKKEHPSLDFEGQVNLAQMYINATPRTRTGYSPLELMTLQGFDLGNTMNYLTEDIREHVQRQIYNAKIKQQERINRGLRAVELEVGDEVWFYPVDKKKKLRQLAYLGIIVSINRDKQYSIQLYDDYEGELVIAHSDQLIKFDGRGECGIDKSYGVHQIELSDHVQLIDWNNNAMDEIMEISRIVDDGYK